MAFSFGEAFVSAGDEIIVSELEHHSNIVPWQLLCERKGATLKVIPINEEGELLVQANTVLAFVDMKTKRPIRAPQYIVDAISKG